MSDTSTVDQAPQGSGRGGQFLGEDLAKLVTLDPSVSSLAGGAILDDRKAEALLALRMGTVLDGEYEVAGRDLAEVIIDALPDDHVTDEVLSRLDLRPYLKALDGKKIVHRTGDYNDESFFKGAAAGTGTADTASLLDFVDGQLREAYSGLLINSPMAADERNAWLDEMVSYDDTRASLTQVAQEETALSAQGSDFMPSTVAGQLSNFGFPEETMRQMVQANLLELDSMPDAIAELSEAAGGGIFPVEISRGTGVGATGKGQSALHTKKLNVMDAMNYLHTLTPSEVESMQVKLGAAGYFERSEAGFAYVEGNSHDAATMAAWKALLVDSIKMNKPVPEVLGTQVRSYRKQVREARLAALPEIDSSYNNITADDYATSILGRRLTTEEHTALNDFVLNLRNERAGYVAGARDNTATTGLQGDTGVTERDVEMFVGKEGSWEAKMNAQQEWNYRMRKLTGD